VSGKYKTGAVSAACTPCLENSGHLLSAQTTSTACLCHQGYSKVSLGIYFSNDACPDHIPGTFNFVNLDSTQLPVYKRNVNGAEQVLFYDWENWAWAIWTTGEEYPFDFIYTEVDEFNVPQGLMSLSMDDSWY
jgi:hypothetical protein